MSGNPYSRTKPMPSLAALAKKLEPHAAGVESGASKAKQKKGHGQEEGDAPRYFGQGAVVKPVPNKARRRVHETHSERVESTLNQYYEDMVEQERKDSTKYSSPRPRAKLLSRKRSLQESNLSHSDDSESRNWRAAVIGGQLDAKFASSRPEEEPAGESDSQIHGDETISEGQSPARESNAQLVSDKVLSKGPSPAGESNPQHGSDKILSKGPSMGGEGPGAATRILRKDQLGPE